MKILFLMTGVYDSPGGIQVFNKHTISALVKLGHRLKVVSINDIRDRTNSNFWVLIYKKFPIVKKIIFIKKALFAFSHLNPDIVLCGHVNFALFCLLLKIIFSKPYFVIVHGIEVWHLSGLRLIGLKNSDKIISVSEFTKYRIFDRTSDYPVNGIFVCHPTVDSNKLMPKPKPQYIMDKLNIGHQDKVILSIARLSRREGYKGYDKVISAMRMILEKIPSLKYIIVGIGDDVPRINGLISANGLESNVILAGFVPQEKVVDYYNVCDVFAMPSRCEGFGIVFLEALACGKPVLAGNKDGSKEAILNGELGLLVDPDDIYQIAESLIRILKGAVDNRLLDGYFLRGELIDNFGLDVFRNRIAELISVNN